MVVAMILIGLSFGWVGWMVWVGLTDPYYIARWGTEAKLVLWSLALFAVVLGLSAV